MTKKSGREIAYVLIPILYGLIAIGIAMLVCTSGQYPFGSNAMSYLYRGETMLEALGNGNIFPMYDAGWYNGVEFLKFSAPLPTYFLAFCQFLAGGKATDGYLIYVGCIFFFSALSWLVIGKRKGRVLFGAFLGLLWFFMPNNLYTIFWEGNLARGFALVILPLLICYVYDYVLEGNFHDLWKGILLYVILCVSDLPYALMIGISFVILTVVLGVLHHNWKRVIFALAGLFMGFMISGIWTVPYLITTADISYEEVMYRYFQSIFISLNPLERYSSLNRYYYFGLAAFILGLFGIIAGRRKSIPGFFTGILLFVGSVSSMEVIMQIMPGSDNLLMCQYMSISLALILFGFMNWESLRKAFQIGLCVLLILDVIPSLDLVYGSLNGVSVEERMEEQALVSLITKAKEISNQRIAFFDGSELESMGTYLVSGGKDGKDITFGGEWNTGETSPNLIQLNRALENGLCPYLFDRSVELGNDTVLIKMSQINTNEVTTEDMDAAAKEAGYQLEGSNEFYRLYHMDVDGNWGTITKYDAIGIGETAQLLSLTFPQVQETSSINLSDYTFEELSKYKMVYLSGFTYNEKAQAEKLIRDLSKAGVQIVIQADGIPEERETRTRNFLGVTCNDITFTNGYPLLDTKNGILDCDFFPQGYGNWETVYVNGLDETWGTVQENDMDLDFYGTVENDNIIVVGLNLSFYYSLTLDEGVGELLSDTISAIDKSLPEREIVPLEVVHGNDWITITSPKDSVNTSLAYHQMFTSRQNLAVDNNLLYVDAGVTNIEMPPFEYQFGLVISLMGMLMGGVLLYVVWYVEKRER